VSVVASVVVSGRRRLDRGKSKSSAPTPRFWLFVGVSGEMVEQHAILLYVLFCRKKISLFFSKKTSEKKVYY
jgi:hypothetical protein